MLSTIPAIHTQRKEVRSSSNKSEFLAGKNTPMIHADLYINWSKSIGTNFNGFTSAIKLSKENAAQKLILTPVKVSIWYSGNKMADQLSKAKLMKLRKKSALITPILHFGIGELLIVDRSAVEESWFAIERAFVDVIPT